MLEIPVPPPPPEIELSFIPRLASGWVGRRRSAAMDPLGKEEEGRLMYFESLISTSFWGTFSPRPFYLFLNCWKFHQIRSRIEATELSGFFSTNKILLSAPVHAERERDNWALYLHKSQSSKLDFVRLPDKWLHPSKSLISKTWVAFSVELCDKANSSQSPIYEISFSSTSSNFSCITLSCRGI